MKPTLNRADIDLLKGTFATKKDLTAMEKRLNTRLDNLEGSIANYEVGIPHPN